MAVEDENADTTQSRSHCKGHSKEFCYKIVGYPPDFKSKRKVQETSSAYGTTGNINYNHTPLTHANLTYGMNTNVPPPGWENISEQHQSPSETTSVNRTVSAAEKEVQHNMWIIDTGATNHMVSSLNMLNKNIVHELEVSKPVYLPNGTTTQCTSSKVSRCSLTNVSHETPTMSYFYEVDHSESPTVDNESEQGTILVLVYVDDMLITGSSLKLIEDTKKALQQVFKMKDLGELKYFLGIEFTRSAAGILMHQRKYTLELIAEVGLTAAKHAGTPIDINVKLTSKLYDEHVNKEQEESDDPLVDQTAYQKIIGKLLYLNMTRPDISFSTQTLSQFLQQPKRSHLDAALRVIRYLKKQPGQGLLLESDSDGQVTAFCDADWASCPLTRKSVIGYMIKIGQSLISWKAKKQKIVSRSSAEAEYRSLASTVSELVWLLGLLKEKDLCDDHNGTC
uniref:Reverse transcriptase Ty1/copia-type domain-containing protein n=1 Tax=Solanum lycopersicum TaxID=4081 RepID=A0A3Q7JL35_SOLLC